jgi:hypothetical protein
LDFVTVEEAPLAEGGGFLLLLYLVDQVLPAFPHGCPAEGQAVEETGLDTGLDHFTGDDAEVHPLQGKSTKSWNSPPASRARIISSHGPSPRFFTPMRPKMMSSSLTEKDLLAEVHVGWEDLEPQGLGLTDVLAQLLLRIKFVGQVSGHKLRR